MEDDIKFTFRSTYFLYVHLTLKQLKSSLLPRKTKDVAEMLKKAQRASKAYDIHVYIKKNATICKISALQSDKTTRTLLWFASGFVQEAPDTELQLFLPNVPQFGEYAAFSRQKAKDCAAHTVEEKWCTWRQVFKCRCGTFVAFFLTYTVC